MKDNLREIWEQHFNDWKNSGLSKSKWCHINNLNIHQLYYWFKRLNKDKKKESEEIKWLPVKVDNDLYESNNNTISIRIGNCNIDVKPGFDSDQLSKVIKVLGNNLNPYKYLEYLLDQLPNIDLNNSEELDSLLPWNLKLPE